MVLDDANKLHWFLLAFYNGDCAKKASRDMYSWVFFFLYWWLDLGQLEIYYISKQRVKAHSSPQKGDVLVTLTSCRCFSHLGVGIIKDWLKLASTPAPQRMTVYAYMRTCDQTVWTYTWHVLFLCPCVLSNFHIPGTNMS